MLTYSFKLNKPITIASLKKIAAAEIVNNLWHANFRLSEEIINSFVEYEDEDGVIILLNTHREETVIASHTFIKKNNLPRIFKAFFKDRICSLYQAYSEMLLWRLNFELHLKIELLDKNKLYAPNYFTVDGDFNDLAWSKSVVLDPNYPLDSRFYLSCFYCFENESAILWSELKNSDLVPCNGNLSTIQKEMNEIVTIRIFQLENKLEILEQNPKFVGNLYKVGFKTAIRWDFEYASYFFWQNLTEQEKININETDTILYSLNVFSFRYPLDKIYYFFYSQFSKEQKKLFLDKTTENDCGNPLLAMLLSPHTEEVRSELMGFVYQLPINLYSKILNDIAYDLIRENRFSFPLHTEVFEVLWNNLSPQEREKVLKYRFTFNIRALIKGKSFYNLNV